jgi:hypothetical protein
LHEPHRASARDPAEEAVEVAQRATKVLRFGIDEVQPGQSLTNADPTTGASRFHFVRMAHASLALQGCTVS